MFHYRIYSWFLIGQCSSYHKFKLNIEFGYKAHKNIAECPQSPLPCTLGKEKQKSLWVGTDAT